MGCGQGHLPWRWTAVAGLVAVAGLILMSCGHAGPAERPESAASFRGPFLWQKSVQGDFEEIVQAVRRALGRGNFPVIEVRDYEKSFTERFRQLGGGELPFHHYRIIEFCNVSFAMESLSTDYRMGVFMPCRLAVFQGKKGGAVTMAAINPRIMPQLLANPELEKVVMPLEILLQKVFDDVDF